MTVLRRVGFFNELRHGDKDGPSLREAVAKAAQPDEGKLVAYLRAGKVYIATPGITRDVLQEKGQVIGPPNMTTDGVYLWPADLAYYVETYHAKLPEDFVAHAKANGWTVPEVDTAALQRTVSKAAWDAQGEDIARRFVKAHLEYDEPAVAAARAAREAAIEDRDTAELRKFYVETGQRAAGETLDQAVWKMARYFADRIEEKGTDIGAGAKLTQPLPSPDPVGYGELAFLSTEPNARTLELRIETPSGKKSAPEQLVRGTRGEVIGFLRAPSAPDAIVAVMKKLVDSTR